MRTHFLLFVLVILSTFQFSCETGTCTNNLETENSPPIIDISSLSEGAGVLNSSCNNAVLQIAEASQKWGFFYITNYGFRKGLTEDLEKVSRAFFDSPTDVKNSVRRTRWNSRGFADDELTKQIQDAKEIFDVGHKPFPELWDNASENVVLDGFNQWPAPFPGLSNFRIVIEEYFEACSTLSTILLKALGSGLGLSMNSETFDNTFQNHSSFLRLNYYPARYMIAEAPVEFKESVFGEHLGISRHTDAGLLTILHQDSVSALEVYTGTKQDAGDGNWIPVPPISEALTINIGDMLQVWSNGKYKAAEHRVRSPPKKRYSSAFFYNPPYDDLITPIVGESVPAKYKPINWGAYRAQRFAGDYEDQGNEIQIENFTILSS